MLCLASYFQWCGPQWVQSGQRWWPPSSVSNQNCRIYPEPIHRSHRWNHRQSYSLLLKYSNHSSAVQFWVFPLKKIILPVYFFKLINLITIFCDLWSLPLSKWIIRQRKNMYHDLLIVTCWFGCGGSSGRCGSGCGSCGWSSGDHRGFLRNGGNRIARHTWKPISMVNN